MGERRRINQNKAGDVLRAILPNSSIYHVCIILEDEPVNGHVRCLPVCNFTGTEVPAGEYAINVSMYDIPEHWFENQNSLTWLRCNHIDCIYSARVNSAHKFGNIKDTLPSLWEAVCKLVYACPINERMKKACKCEFQEIKEKIDSGLEEPYDCNCGSGAEEKIYFKPIEK